ncbi:MAG: SMC-Scp complex subunit ScpB [Anaerovoracaceae bacterium]|jgi:segregation and condensation protein B
MSNNEIKSILESLLFAYGQPLKVAQASKLLEVDWRTVYDCFRELQREYEEGKRGIIIREVDKAFQFCTRPENSEYITALIKPIKVKRLSQSALEVLAIIAYNQPVTKSHIESIRGIRCDRMLENLISKGLVMEMGKGDDIGKPMRYGTTGKFLEYFNLENIKELPDIEEFI